MKLSASSASQYDRHDIWKGLSLITNAGSEIDLHDGPVKGVPGLYGDNQFNSRGTYF
jgi:hypothetical protein